MASVPESPDFFTVEEAARVLRIGRTAAYDMARRWRATDGKEGLPVVAFGRLLRVPRRALEELTGGPVTVPAAVRRTHASQTEPNAPSVSRQPAMPRSRRRHARKRSASSDQTSFPF